MGSQPTILVLLLDSSSALSVESKPPAGGIYSKVVAEPFDSSSDEAVEKSMEKVPRGISQSKEIIKNR